MLVQTQNISTQDHVAQCQRLANVLTLTKQMLMHADNGEWEQVAQQELGRRDDLAACFSDRSPAADVELIAEAMAALLHLNEELMSKLKVARLAVIEQSREYKRNRNALSSYKAVDAASQ
jgi:hypothetical protein